MAGPILGTLLFNLLKALSIPTTVMNLLQLHTQGEEIALQENFFGPLCPAGLPRWLSG